MKTFISGHFIMSFVKQTVCIVICLLVLFHCTACTENLVCPVGTYGKNCVRLCSETKCDLNLNTCSSVDGSCFKCKPGWKGPHCTVSCGKCDIENPGCKQKKGECFGGCQSGWKPPFCREECSPGTYGINCSRLCIETNCDLNRSTCNHTDGSCIDCKSGWYGHYCTEKVYYADSNITVIVAGTIGSILLVGVLIGGIVFLCYRKKRKQTKAIERSKTSNPTFTCEELNGMVDYDDVQSPQILKNKKKESRHSYNNYIKHLPLSKINWKDIKKLEILGRGHFGEVCKGILVKQNNLIVAIKTLRDTAIDKEWQEFVEEMKVMKQIGEHANILKLLGLCYHESKIFMIMEYLIKGDLNTLLRKGRWNKNSFTELSPTYLLQIAIGISKGMDYLAKKQILHRDLAARNVLIADDGTPKIADFGLARKGTLYLKVTNSLLPIRWMAVESLELQIYTTKSDVWSFGVVLWEIATLGATPYYGVQAHVLIAKIRSGCRLVKPSNCNDEMYELMEKCWATNPSDRPDFFQLSDILSDMLANDMGYLRIINNQEDDIYVPIDESLEQL